MVQSFFGAFLRVFFVDVASVAEVDAAVVLAVLVIVFSFFIIIQRDNNRKKEKILGQESAKKMLWS